MSADPPDRSDMPSVSGMGPESGDTPSSWQPKVAGYEIQAKLGEAGQGQVWQAVQLSTHREVALKFPHVSGMVSEKVRALFEREVELAARFDHPNIARIYDSGLHEGVYYYAMELVDGVHLDRYVRTRRLDRKGILHLLAKVARAVQFAHQRGIIHRDLKPSNVLVSEDGEPHVVDFGLAKALLEHEGDMTVSQEGAVRGTPAYMAPEQAAGKIGEVDTRSDVYALGAILYRLLTGVLPHDMSGTPWEVLSRLAKEEVRRPRSLTKTVDPELESLLLKALALEPGDRYASAGELADDIENYLAGEPLSAHRPTTVYFLRKRLKKYRVPVAVAATVLTLLVAMGVWAYVRVADERDRAVEAEAKAVLARDEAEKEADKATAVTAYIQEIFSSIDPTASHGREVSLREVFDRAATEVGTRFEGQPLVQAAIRHTLGVTYNGLGEYEPAREQLALALEIREQHLDKDHPDVLATARSLADNYRSLARFAEAEPLYRRVLKAHGTVPEGDETTILWDTRNVAQVLAHQGKQKEAVALFRAVSERTTRLLEKTPTDSLERASLLRLAALALKHQGDSERALDFYQRGLATLRKVYGNENPHTIGAIDSVAGMFQDLKRWSEAEEYKREGLELCRRVYGDKHPTTFHRSCALARVLLDQGRAWEAIEPAEFAYDGYREILGEDHPSTLDAAQTLAQAVGALGRDEAIDLLRHVVECRQARMPSHHPQLLTAKRDLGRTLKSAGKEDEGVVLEKEVIEGALQYLRLDEPINNSRRRDLKILAHVVWGQGDLSAAEELFRGALQAYIVTLGENHPTAFRIKFFISHILQERGKYAEAEPLLKAVYHAHKGTGQEHNPKQTDVLGCLFRGFVAQGKLKEAESFFRKEWKDIRQVRGDKDDLALQAGHFLASVLTEKGSLEEAERIHREVLGLRHELYGDEDPRTVSSMKAMADTLEKQGKAKHPEALRKASAGWECWGMSNQAYRHTTLSQWPEAEKAWRKIVEGLRKVAKPGNAKLHHAQFELGKALQEQGKNAEAEPLLRAAYEGLPWPLYEHKPRAIWAAQRLAQARMAQGRHEEAEPLWRKVIDARVKLHGEEHYRTAWAMNLRAEVLRHSGRLDEAADTCRRALTIHRKLVTKDHPNVLQCAEHLARILSEQGKPGEAETLREETVQALGDEHPVSLRLMNRVAMAHVNAGDPDTAERWIHSAYSNLAKVQGEEHRDTLWARHFLAQVFGAQGEHARAEAVYREILETRRRVLGPKDRDVFLTTDALVKNLEAQKKTEEAEALKKQKVALQAAHEPPANEGAGATQAYVSETPTEGTE